MEGSHDLGLMKQGTMRVRDIETGTGGRKGIGNKWKMMKSDQSP